MTRSYRTDPGNVVNHIWCVLVFLGAIDSSEFQVVANKSNKGNLEMIFR